ncbi:MAG: hypothetical protein QM705_08410 [Ancrocorticia sp.]
MTIRGGGFVGNDSWVTIRARVTIRGGGFVRGEEIFNFARRPYL